MMNSRPRLAVIHPWLLASGGSEPVALWAAQALRDHFRVSLLTMGKTGLDELNAAYGTGLSESQIEVVRLAVPPFLARRGDALRGYWLARHVRAHAGDFDVLLSSYNVMDFGRPGLQYVSDFSFSDPLRRALMADAGDWRAGWRRAGPARRAYLGLARRWGGQSIGGWKRNATLANSAWTRRHLAEAFGQDAEVVYPPVSWTALPRPWEERADGFVSLGRLVPEKRVGEMAALLGRVRGLGRPLHFHAVGRLPNTPFGRELAGRIRGLGDWATLDGPLYGPAKENVLASHRYGIAGCRHEAFGIAAAEMVRAGMIVWVPRGGGQVEIVDHPDLIYDDEEDAVRKIAAVMSDPSRQTALRAHLAGQAEKFSAERFMEGIQKAVDRFMVNHARRTL